MGPMYKATIVLIEDDLDFRTYLSRLLTARGYAVEAMPDGDQLIARLNSVPMPSLILMDMMLPGSDGIQIMEKIEAAGIDVPVLMVSGAGQVRQVVEAMKLGATDFLTKPFEESDLEAAIQNALQNNPARISGLPSAPVHARPAGFVSVNAKVLRLAEIVKRVAHTDVPILILGESGVGKEVMARYAHTHSGRGIRPFVKVNCAALPNELLESELFGYERGAFTGALTDKTGKFEQAHTGTLLLDEIGEMSPHLQSKLLHVLQDGVFSRLGGRKSVCVDARIIATTNVKMAEAIASGKFREDLYFRLNVVTVELPPLRERREDIPALCNWFMAKYRAQYNGRGGELPVELLNRFRQHDWPGNIRQLENCIRQFLVLPDHHSLFDDLGPADTAVPAVDPQSFSLLDVGANAADNAERGLVTRTLAETHGNRKEAARRMNISYKALLNKIKRWTAPDTPLADPDIEGAKGEAA
jgi:two-component system, NtrC family, response regulator AtoC